MCLGADMAMPPSLLSQAIGTRTAQAGGFFGLYNLLFKLALALAAGIGLPLLSSVGYQPDAGATQGLSWLAMLYGGVPAMLKIGTAWFAWLLLRKEKGAA